MVKAKKPKNCRICKSKFSPSKSTQIVCSTSCAIQHGKAQSAKQAERKAIADRKAHREKKADLKPLSHWLGMTQRVFNDFIRLRDGEVCISCGSQTAVSYHAGHFRTTAKAKQLRFNEDNCHSQCSACNTHQSGNIGPYRINLIAKIGPERVDALESNNEPHRYTREELEELRAHYRQKTRELIKQREGK
ncbi:recombination protein NinG [Tatumella sp. OPLPL6]|uniref:recombination protein NinG n=1 Tax=Tatumella sp. OPLPL6 TaxID=1928657 RepID=UPI000C60AD8F|nr:recombination protein NinG [Tatumella sp. OPLPL6]PIJ41519.1 protein NinG [Tatumella sp. OPLPL6]